MVDKCLPFFKILRKNKAFKWTNESEMAFKQLMEYLGSPHLLIVPNMGKKIILYLSVSPTIMSAMLVKEEDKVQKPIYYFRKVLIGEETRYFAYAPRF